MGKRKSRLTADEQQRIDKATFKQIFHDHWDSFKECHTRYNTAYYDEVMAKMLACGDPQAMGYAGWRCLDCGHFHHAAMTCKSTFCLSCAVPYSDKWVEFISQRLIPGVTYRHLVLTTPEFLRVHFYRNRELLGPFMKLAQPLLQDVFATALGTELDIGTIVVLQTCGRPGNYNVHLHIIFSSGGVDTQGDWKKVSYIPYKMLRRKWQYYLLSFLKEQLPPTVEVKRDIDRGWKKHPEGFVTNVVKGNVPAGGKGLARYLAKYLVSPPITVRRITAYDGQHINYWYREHKTGTIRHETIPALKFIGRMVQHILPKGFQRIRYYGFHSNVRYQKVRDAITSLCLGIEHSTDPQTYRVMPRKPFQLLFRQTYGKDPRECPHCGGTMQLECIWHPKYGMLVDLMHSYDIFQDSA